MPEPSLESLFERYRSRGELEALAAVFDRTAPELLALAAHLVRDPTEAEDLVQGTFVAAIEGARAFDASRRLEPWLAGILARQAARTWRERGRRPDPERLARPEEPDPSTTAELREVNAALARGLAELPPPQRAVLERYLAGERPLAIAHATQRAPGAVRMQILRGLERLRRVLPAGLYGVVPLVRAPRGLAAVRAEVMTRGGLALGGGAAAASLTGGLLVSSKLVLAAVAAALIALFALDRSPRESSRTKAASLAEPAHSQPLARAELQEPRGSTASVERTPLEADEDVAEPMRAPAAAPGVAASVRTGIFLTGALLELGELDPTLVRIEASGGRKDAATQGAADGHYELEITALVRALKGPEGVLYLSAAHPAGRRIALEVPLSDRVRQASEYERTEVSCDVALPPRTAVLGRVEPVEVAFDEVHVALIAERSESADAAPAPAVIVEGSCSEDGGFLLFPPAGGEYTLLARLEGRPAVARKVRVPEGEALDVGELAFESGGLEITGVVRPPFEARVQDWRVTASRVGGADGSEAWQGVELAGFGAVECGASPSESGEFALTGLAPGSYALSLEGSHGGELVVPYLTLTVNAPAEGVVLGQGYGRTRVVVTVPDGKSHTAQLQVALDGGYLCRSLPCGEELTVVSDPRMPLAFTALVAGFRPAKAELPAGTRADEERVELALALDADRTDLELEWTLGAGLLAPSTVTAQWRRGSEEGESSAEASDGGCRFENWKPGSYRLTLEPRGQDSWDRTTSYLCTTSIDVELVPGRTAHARVEWSEGGRARFQPASGAGEPARDSLPARVLDAFGRVLPVRFVQREYVDGAIQIGCYTGSIPLYAASELLPNLLPGSYELVLAEEGQPPLARVPFSIVAGTTVDVPFALH